MQAQKVKKSCAFNIEAAHMPRVQRCPPIFRDVAAHKHNPTFYVLKVVQVLYRVNKPADDGKNILTYVAIR